jgi:hypothetical protein
MSSQLIDHALQGRRSALMTLLGLSAAAGLGAVPGASATAASTPKGRKRAASTPLDFSNPIDNLYAFGKIWAGLDQPVLGGFHGIMYLRMPGKRLVPVFGFTGTGCIQARHDPKGFLDIKSRETGFFTDLRSGDILEYWDNPLTGERCEVYHFYNNLTAGRLTTEIPKFAFGAAGDSPTVMNDGTVFADANGRYPFRLPFSQYGDDLLLQWDYAHEYTNPVTPEGWPTYSTGPRITPSEHFMIYASRRELEDRSLPSARMRAGFSRLSECWPWMRMGKHEQRGLTLFGRMHSHKGLAGPGDIPPKLLAYVEKHAPEYLTLPDGWQSSNKRVETWGAFAMDVPPETPGYEWKARALRPEGYAGPPTGLGRHGYR